MHEFDSPNIGIKEPNDAFFLKEALGAAKQCLKERPLNIGSVVTHPSDLEASYSIKRIEGEIAIVHRKHYGSPHWRFENPEQEMQLPLGELVRTSDLFQAIDFLKRDFAQKALQN